jgi:quinol monooxygenase YgiN
MIYLIILLTVKDRHDAPQVRELLAEQGRLSRQEPGCRRFEVYESQTEEGFFTLCEHWESQAALDQHRTAHAYTQIYQPKVLPLVNRVPHKSTLVE